MQEHREPTGALLDPGLIALVMMLRFQGSVSIRSRFVISSAERRSALPEMLRCAKAFGLKARVATTNWARLANTPMPALAALRDGGFLLLGKAGEDKIIVLEPGASATDP